MGWNVGGKLSPIWVPLTPHFMEKVPMLCSEKLVTQAVFSISCDFKGAIL